MCIADESLFSSYSGALRTLKYLKQMQTNSSTQSYRVPGWVWRIHLSLGSPSLSQTGTGKCRMGGPNNHQTVIGHVYITTRRRSDKIGGRVMLGPPHFRHVHTLHTSHSPGAEPIYLFYYISTFRPLLGFPHKCITSVSACTVCFSTDLAMFSRNSH